MKPIYQENIDDLSKILTLIEEDSTVKSSLLLISDRTTINEDSLNLHLKKLKKPIIGGIFPGLIYEKECKYLGFIVIPLAFELETAVFNLKDNESVFNSTLTNLHSINQSKSILIFYDAMDMDKSPLIDYLFNFFGISLSYFGAGCGQLNFEECPCVISNEGITQNSCVIGLTSEPFAMGMSRSWEPISEQMKASEVGNNISIKSLNWEPAVTVYRAIIEKHLGKTIEYNEIQDLLKSYPIGIVKIDGETVVRDPYLIQNNDLMFFDSILTGEYVSVLYGNKDSILEGAENAKLSMIETIKDVNMQEPEYIFTVNCISRVSYLQEDYDKELEILNKYKPTYGVLSLGEIINPGNSILEIFNKILAIASWKPKV